MPGAEARLRQRIRTALRAYHRHIVVWGMPASAFTGPGRADLFGAAYGRPFNFEIKTATGRPTEIQKIVLRECRAAGSYAWVVRSPEQGLQALAWIERGLRPPMPDEVLDIEDWFKQLDEGTSDAPAEIAAEPTSDNAEVAFLMDNDTGDTMEPSTEALAEMPEVDNRGARRGKYATPETSIQAQADADQNAYLSMEQVDRDVRTVGDRVTQVFEELNALRLELNVARQVIQALTQKIDNLVALVNDDDPVLTPTPNVAPPERAGRKRTQARGRVKLEFPPEAPKPEPTPLDDIPF